MHFELTMTWKASGGGELYSEAGGIIILVRGPRGGPDVQLGRVSCFAI